MCVDQNCVNSLQGPRLKTPTRGPFLLNDGGRQETEALPEMEAISFSVSELAKIGVTLAASRTCWAILEKKHVSRNNNREKIKGSREYGFGK